jgi:hypothetical protein
MKKKTKFEVLLEHFQEFHEKPRAPTTLKSEEEVTSLSGADKREVRDNREKSKYFYNCTTFHIRGALSWHSYVICTCYALREGGRFSAGPPSIYLLFCM